jgi:hypothetical protein
MSVELILGGIGTALGISNFVYWAWWSKRERIKVINPAPCVWFFPKGTEHIDYKNQRIKLKEHSLILAVDCNLAMTGGDKEIEIKGVYFEIDKKPYEILSQYFNIPTPRMILPYDLDEPYKSIILYPKKSTTLGKEQLFSGKDILDELCDKENYPEQPEEDDAHYYKPPNFIKHTLDETSANYKIIFSDMMIK